MPLRKIPFGVEGIFMVISFSFENRVFSKEIQSPIHFSKSIVLAIAVSSFG